MRSHGSRAPSRRTARSSSSRADIRNVTIMKPPPRLRRAGGPQRQNGAVVSLPRALSRLGFCSRTPAEVLIMEGRVCVDGRVVRNVTPRVDPARVRITVDGAPVMAERKVYLMLNKPRGLVTTRDDPHE